MLEHLTTEARNPKSERLDQLTARQIVELINDEDAAIAAAVRNEAEPIAGAIERVADCLRCGGRLIYVGAGTSGRLGVLDAAECPPTFSTDPAMVVGLIAGGQGAMFRAVEGAEDRPELAEADLRQVDLNPRDALVGIATSGRTPYVIGALKYAREVGAFAIGLACNESTEMTPWCDLLICPVVGPEVVSGSTRMKAGTATKMVLNMLSTGAMVRIGKTYGNLMVDLSATNSKLRERARRLVKIFTGLNDQDAQALLDACDGKLKVAIVAHCCQVSPADARERLADAQGQLRDALRNAPCPPTV